MIRTRGQAGLLVAAILIVSCGGDDSADSPEFEPGDTTSVDEDAGAEPGSGDDVGDNQAGDDDSDGGQDAGDGRSRRWRRRWVRRRERRRLGLGRPQHDRLGEYRHGRRRFRRNRGQPHRRGHLGGRHRAHPGAHGREVWIRCGHVDDRGSDVAVRGFQCAFESSGVLNEGTTLGTNIFDAIDGVQIQMQIDVYDDGTAQFTMDDIEDFENPSVSYLETTDITVTVDGDTVRAAGDVTDQASENFDVVAMTFEGECGPGSLR